MYKRHSTECSVILEHLLFVNIVTYFYLNRKNASYLQPQLPFSHHRCCLGQWALWARGTLWSPHQIAQSTPAPAEPAKLPDLFFLPTKKNQQYKQSTDITKLYYLIFHKMEDFSSQKGSVSGKTLQTKTDGYVLQLLHRQNLADCDMTNGGSQISTFWGTPMRVPCENTETGTISNALRRLSRFARLSTYLV